MLQSIYLKTPSIKKIPRNYQTNSNIYIEPGLVIRQMLQLMSRNEDKLLTTITDEQKELFIKYADYIREYQAMVE